MEQEINDYQEYSEVLPGAAQMAQNDAYFDDEYSEAMVRSNIQFTDKVITPGTNAILEALNKRNDLDETKKENYKLLFHTITRDYGLSNLDTPKNRSSWEFSTFVHSFMESMIAKGHLEQALVMNAILLGELNLTKGIGFKQQEAMISRIQSKKYDYPVQNKKGGIQGQFK